MVRTFVVGHRPVRIATLFAACLPACVASDDPSLSVYVDTHGVLISVNCEPDHSFGQVRATINGVDAGTPQYTPGRDGTLKSVSEPATASFLVPQAQIGSSLHVAIDDDALITRSMFPISARHARRPSSPRSTCRCAPATGSSSRPASPVIESGMAG